MLIAVVVLCVSCGMCLGQAYSLPPAVQLGGAIVAAVEQDAEQEHEHEHEQEQKLSASEQRLEREGLEQAELQLRQLLNNELGAEKVINMLDTWTAEGKQTHCSYQLWYISKHATPQVEASCIKRRGY